MTYNSAVLALRDIILGMWPDPIPARCGITACGGARLGIGSFWLVGEDTTAFCGADNCGLARCGRIVPDRALFAGMLPVCYSHYVTIGITETPGQGADPRRVYGTAYDDPGAVIRIVGDNLRWLDIIATRIHGTLDMARHITTAHGTLNGVTADPPTRTVRGDRPRYEVDITIQAEYERPQEYIEET